MAEERQIECRDESFAFEEDVRTLSSCLDTSILSLGLD